MTIYKLNSGDKKPEKKDGFPEVVLEPLAPKEKDEVSASPKMVYIHMLRPRRSRTLANLCLLIMAIAVLGAGIVGGIYLYRYLVHKSTYGFCGVTYYDTSLNESGDPQVGFLQEEVEVPDDYHEKIQVPKFDECEKSLVLHDFEHNYTAIVDEQDHRCFIMPLNRSLVVPPHDLIDLIYKLRTGYYMPDAKVIRQRYRVIEPEVRNLHQFGPYIRAECYFHDTYKLERMIGGIVKRSAEHSIFQGKHYGFSALSTHKSIVFKLDFV